MATEDDKQAARDRLAGLTGRYEAAETHLEQVRKEVTEEIAAILMARTLGPSEVTRLSPFERQHVGRIAKAAGVPPLREATVVSRAKAAAPKESSPAVAAPRPQVTQALPKSVPSISWKVLALPLDRITWLVDKAETASPEWVEGIRQEYPHLQGPDLDYLIVDLGHQKGFKIPELDEPTTTGETADGERPASSEEKTT